jgi:hypothetical protein
MSLQRGEHVKESKQARQKVRARQADYWDRAVEAGRGARQDEAKAAMAAATAMETGNGEKEPGRRRSLRAIAAEPASSVTAGRWECHTSQHPSYTCWRGEVSDQRIVFSVRIASGPADTSLESRPVRRQP